MMAEKVRQWLYSFSFLVFRDKTCYVAQSAIKLVIHQPQPSEYWDYRCGSPYLAVAPSPSFVVF